MTHDGIPMDPRDDSDHVVTITIVYDPHKTITPARNEGHTPTRVTLTSPIPLFTLTTRPRLIKIFSRAFWRFLEADLPWSRCSIVSTDKGADCRPTMAAIVWILLCRRRTIIAGKRSRKIPTFTYTMRRGREGNEGSWSE